MKTDDYLALAERAMQQQVIAPLEARGIPIGAQITEFTGSLQDPAPAGPP